MKKHKAPDAIQTEIRKLENRYAMLFSRSDLKGLVPIKKKLDELKLQLKEMTAGQEVSHGPIAQNSVPKTIQVKKRNSDLAEPAFKTIAVSRSSVNSGSSRPDVFDAFLKFCCPECNSKLNLKTSSGSCYGFECSEGHFFSKEELVALFSHRIRLAIDDLMTPESGEEKIKDQPAVNHRIEILQNVLGIINTNLKFGA